jgi:hypothetical protein
VACEVEMILVLIMAKPLRLGLYCFSLCLCCPREGDDLSNSEVCFERGCYQLMRLLSSRVF